MRFKSLAAVAAFAIALTLARAQSAEISGAGATFPDPIYAKWSEAYEKETGSLSVDRICRRHQADHRQVGDVRSL